MIPYLTYPDRVTPTSYRPRKPKEECTLKMYSERPKHYNREQPTYAQIKDYVMGKYGIKLHTVYIAEVKRMHGINMQTNIQVSPGSKRHGDVPYVKISTKDIGKIKIIGATESQYKTDGKEKATLLFRRYR